MFQSSLVRVLITQSKFTFLKKSSDNKTKRNKTFKLRKIEKVF